MSLHQKNFSTWLLFGFALSSAVANPLESLSKSKVPALQKVFGDIEKFQPQILYTTIKRGNSGKIIALKTHSFNVDPDRYFYPASTIKLPAAILALEFLNKKSESISLSRNTRYEIFGTELNEIYPDPLERTSAIAIDIEKIAVISGNMAFNRLYDLIGPDTIESRLQELGLRRPRMSHRLAISLAPELNRTLLGFHFEGIDRSLLAERRLPDRDYLPIETIGRGYLSRGEFVQKPFPVHRRNFIGLTDLHETLLGLVLGDQYNALPQFEITNDQRSYLKSVFSRLPRESVILAKEDQEKPDNYVKFLVYGDRPDELIPDSITIINKIGQAYGFLTDTAYIMDEAAGIEFGLSATVFVNENLIFNDNQYEYDQIGLPFLGELGRQVLELERAKK
ncbi:MAG: serine hydrolase [Verrucomicrobiota bacterium]